MQPNDWHVIVWFPSMPDGPKPEMANVIVTRTDIWTSLRALQMAPCVAVIRRPLLLTQNALNALSEYLQEVTL